MAGDPLTKPDALADNDIAEKLSESVAKRLDGVEDSDAGAEDKGDDDETASERAKSLHERGELTAKVLTDAIKKSERTFIMHALSFAAYLLPRSIEGVFKARSGKSAMPNAREGDLGAELAVPLKRNL